MRIGLIGYSNKSSGIGLFCWEFLRYLDVDSMMAVRCVKGRERWSDRQMDVALPPTTSEIENYLEQYRPDVLVYFETPFNWQLGEIARKHGVKTAGVVMHETTTLERVAKADLVICPCKTAWDKLPVKNKKLLFLPIGMEFFPFRERAGHVFNCSIGYGGVHDRRQVAKVVQAFREIKDPEARLVLNCQNDWPPGTVSNDPRIAYNRRNYPKPSDVYEEGDISILPIAYGGYERMILESMASGLPTLTMNADPMNLFQPDERFLLEPKSKRRLTSKYVFNTVYNEVSADDLREKMEWLLTVDTARFSRDARTNAEARSWESKETDYKGIWLDALEAICS